MPGLLDRGNVSGPSTPAAPAPAGQGPSRNLPGRSPGPCLAGSESDFASSTDGPPEQKGWERGGQRPWGCPMSSRALPGQNPPLQEPAPPGVPPLLQGPHLGAGGGLLGLLVFTDANKPREAKGDPLLAVHLAGGGVGGVMETLLWSSLRSESCSNSLSKVYPPSCTSGPSFVIRTMGLSGGSL